MFKFLLLCTSPLVVMAFVVLIGLAFGGWLAARAGRPLPGGPVLNIVTWVAAIIAGIASAAWIVGIGAMIISGPGTAAANAANATAREVAIANNGFDQAADTLGPVAQNWRQTVPAGAPSTGLTDLEIEQDWLLLQSIAGITPAQNRCVNGTAGVSQAFVEKPNADPLVIKLAPQPNGSYRQFCITNPPNSGVVIDYKFYDQNGKVRDGKLHEGESCNAAIWAAIPRKYTRFTP